MFKRRTLFVIGAGASAEFGLPVGRDLASRIATKVDIRFEFGNSPIGAGDLQIFTQLTQNFRQHLNEFQQAGWLIRDGIPLARSIDDFLDLHRSKPFAVSYGKAAIVNCILEAERASNLYYGRNATEERFTPRQIC